MTATIEHGLSYRQYDARPGLRSSELKKGAKSMLHMRHYIEHGSEPTPAMIRGVQMHAAVLEPAVFARTYVIWDGGRKQGPTWVAFKAEHDDKEIISIDEHAALLMASEQVWSHRGASGLLRATKHEASLFWHDSVYGAAKIRLDGICERQGIIEYKTSGSVDQHSFANTCAKMGYDIQMGWGWHAAMELTGRADMPYHVIAQEQKAPYDVVVYRVPDSVLKTGYERAEAIAREYRACETMNVYAGICGEVVELEWPVWAGGEAVEIDVSDGEMEAGEL